MTKQGSSVKALSHYTEIAMHHGSLPNEETNKTKLTKVLKKKKNDNGNRHFKNFFFFFFMKNLRNIQIRLNTECMNEGRGKRQRDK